MDISRSSNSNTSSSTSSYSYSYSYSYSNNGNNGNNNGMNSSSMMMVTNNNNSEIQKQQQTERESCFCSLFGGVRTNSGNFDQPSFRKLVKAKVPKQQIVGGSGIDDDDDDAEAQLAKELNALTVEERERVYDDVHGVTEIQEETSEFIQKCIDEMDLHLSQTPKSRRKAYDRAIFFKPTIANDKDLKLLFLRACMYDGEKASARILKHFKDKLELFGESKLVKDITLDDLTEEDMEVFGRGYTLELPHKDQVGRPILTFDPTRYDFDRPDSVLRCAWYLVMAMITSNEDAQKTGVSDVICAPGDLFSLKAPLPKVKHLFSKIGDVNVNLPIRVSSMHVCYDDSRMQFVLNSIRQFFGKHIRLRLRAHYGSAIEIEYSLLSFGITPFKAFVPTEHAYADHDMRIGLHQKYIQRRKEIEAKEHKERIEQETKSGIILYPQPNDVLIGKGRPYQNYPGNRRYGAMIDSNLDLYHKEIDRFAKMCLTMDIVKQVQAYGGRFIERTKDGMAWKVIDDVVAREKTAIGFRSRVKKVTPDAEWNATKESRARGPSSTNTTKTSLSSSSNVNKRPRYNNNNNNSSNNSNNNHGMALTSF